MSLLEGHDVDSSGRFAVEHQDLVVRELHVGVDPFDHGSSEFDPHLIADVPVGAFLSSGIDSTAPT